MKKIFLFFIIVVITAGCTNTATSIDKVKNYISQAKEKFAPDKRTAIFDVNALYNSGNINLIGKTNVSQAKLWILKSLKYKNIKVQDNIELLPSKNLGDTIYAMIHLSVANLRTQAHDYAELATQALLGTPLRILEKNKKGDWYRVQTPDNYIAWIEHSYITPMTKMDLNAWKKSKKVIYQNVYGFSYSEPTKNSQVVSDLVEGDILEVIAKKNKYYKVKYPDGRTAYVPSTAFKNYNDWMNNTSVTFKKLYSTAKEFMGIPYLWGGTSPKAFDCSGFTKTLYFLHGVILPRDASQQINVGDFVNSKRGFKNLQPGDLLFFGQKGKNGTKDHITHVGLYIGNDKFINASAHYAGRVLITSLDKSSPLFNQYRYNTFIKAKRILTSLNKNGIRFIKDDSLYNDIPLE